MDAGQVILVKCNNTTVENLNLYNTTIGVELWETSNAKIAKNIITNNRYDIYLRFSSNNNNISGNNITNINNARQVYNDGSPNVWDDGYPSSGNYWSDYTGVDLYTGPYQNETGSDGIGDTPYIIDENNRDQYPLMNPYPYSAPSPPTYSLTTTTAAGGITNPPRNLTYPAGLYVEVTAIPSSGYIFDHWELDDVNVGSANPCTVLMVQNHTLKAIFSIQPLSVSITLSMAEIKVGESVTFTSTVSGGLSPYSYQWYVNGAAVEGATSQTWKFTHTTPRNIHYTPKRYGQCTTDSKIKHSHSNSCTAINGIDFSNISLHPCGTISNIHICSFWRFPPYTYQWYLNNAPVSGATQPCGLSLLRQAESITFTLK